METRFNVAGITFRVKDNEAVRDIIPDGAVELRHNPFIHDTNPEYNDMQAVEVWIKGMMVGYIPKQSKAREDFFEGVNSGVDIKAVVTDFKYAIYDGNLNLRSDTFNSDLDGYIGSIEVSMESAVSGTHYTINGADYIRVTKIAGMIDDVGFVLPPYLYGWMTKTGDKQLDYDGYLAKIEGTRVKGNNLHDACEAYAKDRVMTPQTPHGLDEFFIKHNIEVIDCEQVVKHGKKYRVAGRYDMLAYADSKSGKHIKTIIDWKSGGTLKIAYLLQCAFYAYKTGAQEFWIVLFGTKNKCGYSVKRFDMSYIEPLSKIFVGFVKTVHQLGMFKEFKGLK